MSKLKSTVSPGSFYPSPPASPQRSTTHNEATIEEVLESSVFDVSKNKVVSNKSDVATPNRLPEAEPASPSQLNILKAVEGLTEAVEKLGVEIGKLDKTITRLEGGVEGLILQTWKWTLLLHEGTCGAFRKRDKQVSLCDTEIASRKTAGIDQLVAMLRRPNQSASEMETRLDSLAKLVCCPEHLNPPIRWSRIDKWLVAMPGGPYTATPQRRLHNKWAWARYNCSNFIKDGTLCKRATGPANRYFCRKTIAEMVQVATTSCNGHATLDFLVTVLQHHMRCSQTHYKSLRGYHSDWQRAIGSFREACVLEKSGQEYENAIANAYGTGAKKAVANGSQSFDSLRTPPPSPNSRRLNKKPQEYWDTAAFDTSPFHILLKGDIFEDAKTPGQMIQDIVKQTLNNNNNPLKKAENEVNDGRVYIFTVPGNDGFVKIGFTTKDGTTREDQWKKACNRDPTTIYKTELIPHAHRVERLVHAELMEERVRIYCERCQKQHTEWFETSKDASTASVKKWSAWIGGNPYEKKGGGWKLKGSESEKLQDVEVFLKGLEEAAQATL